MLSVGQVNRLTILRGTSVGFFLGNAEGDEVLLPHKYIPEEAAVGEEIDVFIYRDSEDRIIATNLRPHVALNEMGCLEVTHTSSFGAFLAWGLEKDLFVPFREQNQRLSVGDWAIVYVYLDEKTDRLVGTCKIQRHLEPVEDQLVEGQAVNLLIYERTDLGYKAVINNLYGGLLYHNQIFRRVAWGDIIPGFVKTIRPDGKVDVELDPPGAKRLGPDAERVWNHLEKAGGTLPYSDTSDPIDIQAYFEMSKKAFKRAIGILYKDQKIDILPDKIQIRAKPTQ